MITLIIISLLGFAVWAHYFKCAERNGLYIMDSASISKQEILLSGFICGPLSLAAAFYALYQRKTWFGE